MMDSRAEKIHDIYHTVFLLQQKLVRDVIPAIVEYAELYESTTCEATFRRRLRITEDEAPKQLLVCEVPSSLARVQRPVRAITFNISSHDQGFASDLYAGSWTWFSAQKLHAAFQTHQSGIDNTSAEAVVGDHREISRNPIASGRWFTHEVVWRADSQDPVEAEWVSSLQAGEKFAVHAWARFGAWVNHVSDISVRVDTVAMA